MARRAENYLEFVKGQHGYYSNYGIYAPLIDAGGQVYNVKSLAYGAKGDGVTNDTVSIQAALTTASNAGGGVVYLPVGTYIVSPTGINVGSNTILRGSGWASIVKVPNGANTSGNIVKAQSVSNVWFDSFTIDGNSANQSAGTNFGSYFGGVTNGAVTNLFVKNMTGDGIHAYNSTGIKVFNNWSTGNTYHGYEIEQCIASTWQANRAYTNNLHGIIINPGEVSGTGTQGVSVIGNICDGNLQYGIAAGVANGDTSQHLSTDCLIANNIVRNNLQYGVQLYQQNGFAIVDNAIHGNGFFGMYVYQSSYNQITGNRFHNNSQASNGSYDEIYFEGNAGGYAATHNMVNSNMILIDGVVKARYAINEGTSSDGPNTIIGNIVPNAGTSGRINSIATGDISANNLTS